jgi:outer membrane protein assembly factor BamE
MRPTAPARVLALLAAALALGGCSSLQSTDSFLGVVTPYRLEIVQGNVVTKEMAAALQPGMSRAQVRDVLGTPLLADIFHTDRWDYVFSIRRQGTPYQQRRVTVLFDGESMKAFEADELPSESDFVASIDTRRKDGKLPKLALSTDELNRLPAPPKRATTTPAATPLGAARSYPPLEATP